MIQPQINSLVVAQKFDYALDLLEKNADSYGRQNRLLYFMDYGAVAHMSGRYERSIEAFENAKKIYDQLYTVSLSKQAATWLINDTSAPYRPEDFERALINIFQAVNFAKKREFDEALVEARDVNNFLSLVNRQYGSDQKNVYRDDAFVRFLMGVFYQASGTFTGTNDAYISYERSWDLYQNDFSKNYNVLASQILKENLLSTAKQMGSSEYQKWKKILGDQKIDAFEKKRENAEIYLVHYEGLSPVKRQVAIPIPLPGGIITRLAFPVYQKRDTMALPREFRVVQSQQAIVSQQTQLVDDIEAIAVKNLDDRKVRVLAKAVARAGVKYGVESLLKKKIDEHDTGLGRAFGYLSSLYNLTSEQADLRSWQTLPRTIRLARVYVEAGEYDLFLGDSFIQKINVQAGQTYFVTTRTR